LDEFTYTNPCVVHQRNNRLIPITEVRLETVGMCGGSKLIDLIWFKPHCGLTLGIGICGHRSTVSL
jgi:hypothetical protein